MKESTQMATGISLPVVVFIVFLTLKLCGVISWSWWLVTSPLWIIAAVALVLIITSMIVLVIRVRKQNRHNIHHNK